MVRLSRVRTVERFAILLSCATAIAVGTFFAAKYLKTVKTSAITPAGSPVRISYERTGTATEPADRVGWVKFRSLWSSPMFLVQPNPSSSTAKYTAFCLDPNVPAPTEGDNYEKNGQTYEYKSVVKEDNDINNQLKLAVYMATAPATDTAVNNKLNEWFSLENIADYWKTDNEQGLNVTDGAYGMRNYRYIMFHALLGYVNNNSKPDTDSRKIALDTAWDYLAESEQAWVIEKAAELSTMITNNSTIWQTAKKYKLYGLDMSVFPEDVLVQDIAWIEQIPYSIDTYAQDAVDGDEYVEATKDAKIIDNIEYCGEKGVTYTISGMVMKKTGIGTGEQLVIDGEEVKNSISVTPTADNGCGEATMTFDLDASTLAGKELVIFENLYSGNDLLVTHNDWNDSLQTIDVVFLDTDASDKTDGDKKVFATKDAIITDHIKYCLPAGTYTIFGALMNKKTGEPITVDNKEISNSTEVTTGGGCGELDMEFAFDATGLGGTEIVAFERAAIEITRSCSTTDPIDGDSCIVKENADGENEYYYALVSHQDLNDAAQTVLITNPATPETGIFGTNEGSADSTGKLLALIAIAAPVTCIGFYLAIRFTSRKKFFNKKH